MLRCRINSRRETVNAAGAYALGEAIRYIEGIGFEEITKREDELTALAMEEMKKNPVCAYHRLDRPEDHHGILAFTVPRCASP